MRRNVQKHETIEHFELAMVDNRQFSVGSVDAEVRYSHFTTRNKGRERRHEADCDHNSGHKLDYSTN